MQFIGYFQHVIWVMQELNTLLQVLSVTQLFPMTFRIRFCNVTQMREDERDHCLNFDIVSKLAYCLGLHVPCQGQKG